MTTDHLPGATRGRSPTLPSLRGRTGETTENLNRDQSRRNAVLPIRLDNVYVYVYCLSGWIMLHMLPIRLDNVEDFLTYTKSLLSVLCTMLTCYCPYLTCIICLKYLIKQKEVIKECVNICQMVAQFGTRWLKKLISGIDRFPLKLTFTSDFLTARSRFSLGICSSWPRVWPTSALEFSKEPGNTGCCMAMATAILETVYHCLLAF